MSKKKKQIPEHQRKRIEEITLFIKNWRISEGLSQHEFGILSDSHTNTIYNIETHSKNISILTILNCIDAMELTVSQFFEGVE